MKNAHYQIAVYIFSAARSVLKDLLRFIEIDQGLLWPIECDFGFGLIIEFMDSSDKFF